MVEAGNLAELRHLSTVLIEADLESSPPDLSRVPGVTRAVVTENHVRCHVTGPIQPLLAALVTCGVRQLLSREPSLEELFLAYYGATAAQKEPSGVV